MTLFMNLLIILSNNLLLFLYELGYDSIIEPTSIIYWYYPYGFLIITYTILLLIVISIKFN